ncbi:MAG: hypothetical protein AB8I56_05285, partial [Anaerolineales bacterium]
FAIRNLCMMSDGKYFVSSGGSEISVWETLTFQNVANFTSEGEVHTLRLIPRSRIILAQDYTGQTYSLELKGLP